MLIELSPYTLQIIVISETDAADERTEGRLVFLIAGDGEGSHAPSVEGMVHGDDLVIIFSVLQPRVLAGRLNCALDSLGAAVGKEYPAHAAHAHQLVSCLCGRLIVIQVGGMHQLIDLSLQRLIVARVMITQGLYRDTCREVQIFFAVGVVEIDTVAVIQYHLIPVVGVKHALFRLFDNRLFIFHHNNFPLPRPGWQYRFPCW